MRAHHSVEGALRRELIVGRLDLVAGQFRERLRDPVTEADGRYRVAGLVPGRYDLKVELAGFGPVEPEIAYLKLAAMVEGARVASKILWP